MGKKLVKWKDRRETSRNLPKTHKTDAEVAQKFLQSSKCLDSTDENRKNRV